MATSVRLVVFGGLAVVGITSVIGLLIGAPAGAVIAAFVTGESVVPEIDAPVGEKVNDATPAPMLIALVEDESTWVELTSWAARKAIPGASIEVFPTCESLLFQMDPPLNRRFQAYLLDFNQEDAGGKLKGDRCTREIHARDPGALLVGLSARKEDPGFVGSGTRGFVSKLSDLTDIVNALTSLLHP